MKCLVFWKTCRETNNRGRASTGGNGRYCESRSVVIYDVLSRNDFDDRNKISTADRIESDEIKNNEIERRLEWNYMAETFMTNR